MIAPRPNLVGVNVLIWTRSLFTTFYALTIDDNAVVIKVQYVFIIERPGPENCERFRITAIDHDMECHRQILLY